MARIKVNELPNPKGSVFTFALWGTFLYVGGGIIGIIPYFYNDIKFDSVDAPNILSTIINLSGLILLSIFFSYFTKACKILGQKEVKNIDRLFAFFISIQILVEIFDYLPIDYHQYSFWKIFVIMPIIALIYYFKVATTFKNNYSGLLSETGKLMLRYLGCSFLAVAAEIIFIFFYLIDKKFSLSTNGEFEPIKYVIIGVLLILPLFVLTWVVWTRLICTMDELMERGYQAWIEGVREIGCGTEENESDPTGYDQTVLIRNQRNYNYSSTSSSNAYTIDENGDYIAVELNTPTTMLDSQTLPLCKQDNDEVERNEDKENRMLFTLGIMALAVLFLIIIICLFRVS